jgi:RNA polymerase II transcription elongation factor
MAVQHSPALPPLRPGLIDPSRQAEYPIILGNSLSAKNAVDSNKLLNVRYNWKSKQIPQRQVITDNHPSSGSHKLVVREDTSEPYKYNGTADPRTTQTDSACLALVFDKDKSTFVLESISKSLNFNLTYATTKPNIEQLPQLDTINSTHSNSPTEEHDERRDSDEDAADPQNPYDYRHFLAEARKNAEAEHSTPKVFATGMPSPTPGASRILATSKSATSLQSPFMAPSKRRKVETKPVARGPPKTSNPITSNVPHAKPRSGTKMSKGKVGYKTAEKVVSSDEERQKSAAAPAKPKHNRDGSKKYMPSPNIIVDEASDLTIDMGSPPPAAKYKHRINPDAFSSNSRPHSRANTASVSPQGEDSREDSERDVEGDIEMDDGDEDDDDIEDLALPSPRATRALSNNMNRISHDSAADDDDEDDGLAAELEAVFEQEDDGDNGTVGLGISAGQEQGQVIHEEESEVSEEE